MHLYFSLKSFIVSILFKVIFNIFNCFMLSFHVPYITTCTLSKCRFRVRVKITFCLHLVAYSLFWSIHTLKLKAIKIHPFKVLASVIIVSLYFLNIRVYASEVLSTTTIYSSSVRGFYYCECFRFHNVFI